MTKSFDYVMLSQQSWDVGIGSNAKNIAQEISKEHRVLYVNRPLDLQTKIKANVEDKAFIAKRTSLRGMGIEAQIEEVQTNLFVLTPKCLLMSINGIPDGVLYDRANRYNNSLIANEIKRALKYLDIDQYVFINDGEIFNGFYLNELLDAKKNVYYYRDYFLAVPYWRKHGKRLEPLLLSRYDEVVCNSEFLAKQAAKHNPHSRFVGQGCDFTYFEIPKERMIVPFDFGKPLIGYVGALNSARLDVKLLENLAMSNPQWHWMFVGPEDSTFKASLLHDMSNVSFTGSKPQEELASFISQFDVALNPQLVNEVTVGNYPRKIDEYLYMGKPVVATRTSAMKMFSEYCYLALGEDSYTAAIQRALSENSIEKESERIEFAASHSWENSVKSIYQSIAS